MGKRKNVIISEDEIQKQENLINHIYKLNLGKNLKYTIKTYGCQMNEHDSEKLSGMLAKMGYTETDVLEDSDIIIYNTCAVRENAELKVYGNLGQLKNLKQNKPSLKIIVCGCMMQQPHIVEEIKNKYNHVDIVFGTHNLYKFPELLAQSFDSDMILVDVWDIEGEVLEGLPSKRKYDLKGFVNVMYGCNNFCTYCIVPYTRGRERSREPEKIIQEVKELANNGTKEITLLGQNVNSYGKTLDKPFSFADLLRELNNIDGIERIRFMTSHPKDLSDELIYAIRDCEKVCEHVHLPLQSGSSRILEIMNRKYDQHYYLSLVEKIRKEIPNVAFTTDIIVGFPGETEEDFLQTLEVVKKVRYDSAFTFIYSIRQGTPAADMKEQIPDNIKHERFNRLLSEVNAISSQINSSYKDKVVEVLVEGYSKTDKNKLTGRTRQNKLVNFEGTEDLIGKLVNVKITEPKTFSLNGIVAK
ncbi:tRNA-2-methylthio-N6-dimethylallyladenosine synthase [Alkalithermobacter thermoalcaliphilus JW-YL-7 = DSM 7308]|uniref:tRNA-2-methylthio-N(6)-dimethylallyladenosine synthase n=1 Tax=Alkalithermobacter thermoalcaliphilus JW-YL-7 = DSM 7308 TaxID=1121328 RepID=A0A150FQJ1_CLOPD|nr:(Dimethylallyl)adenosine tRNA methylthiotransferase miaB [[Clostridium] paradoxum JW-YL-7 = DSM 7308]SHK80372.1 tRNA-2-methylthio-N6-dimethylallyladenosine synthase [[Clostridium] paradoxum JW-YL-7 = DSM 7308]